MKKKQQYRIAIMLEHITAKAGIERAVLNLIKILKKDNHHITIISLYTKEEDKSYFGYEKEANVIHLNASNKNAVTRYISYIKIWKMSNEYLKRYEFDYIIGTTHGINCIIAYLGKDIKKIGCEHFNYDSCPSISKKLRKWAYPKLDAVVLLTKSDSKHYGFIDDEKIFIIPNAVSCLCEKPSELQSKKIIAAGRLAHQKGFDMLIEAAAIMKKKLPDWELNIYGDGDDKEKLIKQIELLGLTDFIHIYPTTSDIKDRMLESSIYVMSSRYEGLPMILIEAQACGLPIVSFDCPEGPSEIVMDGESGYLVECGDITTLADKVIYLAQNSDKRVECGKMAYKGSTRFSNEIIHKKWNELFDKI